MWQDAGRYGGIIGVGLAKLNPGRWSQVLCVATGHSHVSSWCRRMWGRSSYPTSKQNLKNTKIFFQYIIISSYLSYTMSICHRLLHHSKNLCHFFGLRKTSLPIWRTTSMGPAPPDLFDLKCVGPLGAEEWKPPALLKLYRSWLKKSALTMLNERCWEYIHHRIIANHRICTKMTQWSNTVKQFHEKRHVFASWLWSSAFSLIRATLAWFWSPFVADGSEGVVSYRRGVTCAPRTTMCIYGSNKWSNMVWMIF